MREGELIALKGMDIDFKGKFIDVRRSISRGQVSTPKNGKSRRVDMSTQLASTPASAVVNEALRSRTSRND